MPLAYEVLLARLLGRRRSCESAKVLRRAATCSKAYRAVATDVRLAVCPARVPVSTSLVGVGSVTVTTVACLPLT